MSLATTCVNGVCTCVLPLPANDFRPLALRHRSLAFISALLITVKVVALLALAITPTTAELSTITVARVVQLTNAERQKAGQSTLAVNAKLSAAAQRKGEDMLANDYFAHISPAGVTPWFWMQQQGYTYQVAGENLAIDFVEVEDVVAAWMASPSHRDNMLHSAYTETGVAVVTGEFQGGTSTVVVHMFGLPTGSPSPIAPQSGATGDTAKKPPTTAGTQTESTATPTPTPTPTPLPAPLPDTTPPRTPRIAVAEGTASVVATTVTVTADTEANTSVRFLVNNVLLAQAAGAKPTVTLDLHQFADGELQIEAVAEDSAGNTSERSNAVRLNKDSTAPALAEAAVSFLLGPQTDRPVVLASITSREVAQVRLQGAEGWQSIPLTGPIVVPLQSGPTALALTDSVGNSSEPLSLATLLPAYTVTADTDFVAPPSRFNRVSRWLMGSVLILITLLLSLAIFVRISIQRPALIAHASLVLVLAAVFLLA